MPSKRVFESRLALKAFNSQYYSSICCRHTLARRYSHQAAAEASTKSSSCRARAFDLLFLGRNEFSCLVLEELCKAPDVYRSITITTQPDEWIGRGRRTLSVSPLKTFGHARNIPVVEIPHRKPDLKLWKPPPPFDAPIPLADQVIITASFGRILPRSLLHRFPASRRLNVHPSLLPAYRGPAPIQHALLRGEKETGVCVIEMMERAKGIDAGPVWGMARIPIDANDTFSTLRDSSAREGGKLLVQVLRDMLVGRAQAVPQVIVPEAEMPKAPAITAEDAMIDFNSMSATGIVRRYRAIAHQRPLLAYLFNGKAVQLHSPSIYPDLPDRLLGLPPSHVVYDSTSAALLIRCADDSVLATPMVKQENKALMSALEWWNGVKGLGLVRDGSIRFCPGL
ncbi:hypothetical protein HGRIS_011405 [Hohenbuehelia grisea]|uniref:methionyl-tRNA formyltransferase n=1 Tax=Hohenbuehelia grisea TaxID=104357 RepID=A0ABR3JV73_9AGAR